MLNVRRTGLIKAHTGICDHIAFVEIERNGEWIPCRIGYDEHDDGEEYSLVPAFIFIGGGITENGNHYERETIELDRWQAAELEAYLA